MLHGHLCDSMLVGFKRHLAQKAGKVVWMTLKTSAQNRTS
jgi:hypothetical protein